MLLKYGPSLQASSILINHKRLLFDWKERAYACMHVDVGSDVRIWALMLRESKLYKTAEFMDPDTIIISQVLNAVYYEQNQFTCTLND